MDENGGHKQAVAVDKRPFGQCGEPEEGTGEEAEEEGEGEEGGRGAEEQRGRGAEGRLSD